MTDLISYLNNVNIAIVNKNGKMLSQLLNQPFQASDAARFTERIQKLNITSYCESNLRDNNLAGVVAHRLLALTRYNENNFEEGRILIFKIISKKKLYSSMLYSVQ